MIDQLATGVGRHPIGVVAERTGLSPDLLRVWERRYRAVEPSRATDGQRLYSDADVERLRLLRLATHAGRSIRQVAQIETGALTQLVREDESARQRAVRWEERAIPPSVAEDVERALELARAVDAAGLDSLLRRTAAALGVPLRTFYRPDGTWLAKPGSVCYSRRLSLA